MYLLDSDTLVHLHAGHENVVKRFQQLDEPLVATTVISRIELLRGRFDFVLKAKDGEQLIRAQQLLDATDECLGRILVLKINRGVAKTFGSLLALRSLRKIGRNDLLIAAMTIVHVQRS